MTELNGGERSEGVLRERNRVRVVDALRRQGMASRSDLARMTGLSRTTVGSLVADLQARGLVVEHVDGDRQHGRGRPPIVLRLDRSAGVAVGIDFDHDRVRVALADLSSTVLGEDCAEIDVDHSAGDAIDAAVEMVEALRRSAGVDVAQLVGAGVGLPGPIDRRTGEVGSAVILPGWAGLPARETLGERLGLDVQVDNDANLGALAEASFGAGRGLSDVVYVRLGSGLGAGLVIGGRLHHGAAGLAGEIGHVQVNPYGALCRCGNRGCLETIASEGAIRALLRPGRSDDLTRGDLLELVAAGDLGATRVVNDAGLAIGRVLADLCNAVNPEAVVVGGELSEAGEPLLGGIRDAIDRYALPGAADVVRVVHGELGERAEVLGALALVTQSPEVPRWIGLETVVECGSAASGGRAAWRPAGRKEAVHAETR
ncbi:MAG TPA: ROK family transcriptional regulator [Gaiellaceae bacterium]|nr:ROK family transcriptional regulator [Gaiellaceae bacterium]